MKHEITIEKVKNSRISEVDFENIVFGRIFADHMLVSDYYDGGWHDTRIMPFQNLSLSPATTALHYGQEIFEGMKAYIDKDGNPVIFRPDANFSRMNISAERMCMPDITEEIFLGGLKELINLDRAWIPTLPGSSLYIRPFMISTDEFVGIRPSDTYKFIIFCSPVNAYYPEPIKVKIEDKYVRASPGGTGAAKNAGNYGASLYPSFLAQKEGYKQLLWTDAVEHKWIEESGTMNVFFVIDDVIVTPDLDGNILDGITRDSSITLLKEKGEKVEERPVSVDEIVEAHKNGKLQEVFGAGTAATIAHITHIGVKGDVMELPAVEGRRISNWLLETMDGIKHGRIPDTHNWLTRL